METVREGVFVAQEDMEHLDTRKIIPDGWRFHGPTQELRKPTYGLNITREWCSAKIHTKTKVAALDFCLKLAEYGSSVFKSQNDLHFFEFDLFAF